MPLLIESTSKIGRRVTQVKKQKQVKPMKPSPCIYSHHFALPLPLPTNKPIPTTRSKLGCFHVFVQVFVTKYKFLFSFKKINGNSMLLECFRKNTIRVAKYESIKRVKKRFKYLYWKDNENYIKCTCYLQMSSPSTFLYCLYIKSSQLHKAGIHNINQLKSKRITNLKISI